MTSHTRWLPLPDGSRDPRIEDPTNRWIVHLAGRALLPLVLRTGLSANSISVAGLLLGAGGAWAFYGWREPLFATAGLLFCILWMIADGLDGMVARATRTASPTGRFLDGLCDHGVFLLLYLALAASLGTSDAWLLAAAAGAAHAVQSTLYEGERTRFHRRLAGLAPVSSPPREIRWCGFTTQWPAVSTGRRPHFDRLLAAAPDKPRLIGPYVASALPALRTMVLLTNNTRVLFIWLACLAGDPRIFWWVELVPLSVLAAGCLWTLRVRETHLVDRR